jgi:hypothetical protein
MTFAKVVSVVFNLLGALLCLLAIIAGGFSATALVARIQHGPGIMFADVEFFALTGVAFLVPGVALLIVSRQLKKRVPAGSRKT